MLRESIRDRLANSIYMHPTIVPSVQVLHLKIIWLSFLGQVAGRHVVSRKSIILFLGIKLAHCVEWDIFTTGFE